MFGPTRAAAKLEWSKGFAKEFMARHGIPTAAWSSHDSPASAHAAITGPCVVKADGLAAGKGVFVATSEEDAHAAIDKVFSGAFGAAGERVILEELLVGEELSLLALCDGHKAVPLLPCRDYKRRFDGDQGPNTGGMGAICPVPGVGPDLIALVQRTVLDPVVKGMAAAGTPFRGVLYVGLMLTRAGPRVLEFNTRFGDPETQPLMMMLDQDIVPLLLASARGCLPDAPIQWREGGACCVVVVAGGYPERGASGAPIHGVKTDDPDMVVFYGGARRDGSRVLAEGGRVLGVTAWGPRPAAARVRVYRQLPNIGFEGSDYRKDIAIEVLPPTASARQQT